MNADDEILDYASMVPEVTRRVKLITLTECERRIAEAVASEREACLSIVEDLELPPCNCLACVSQRRIAAAIRARGEVKC